MQQKNAQKHKKKKKKKKKKKNMNKTTREVRVDINNVNKVKHSTTKIFLYKATKIWLRTDLRLRSVFVKTDWVSHVWCNF